MTTSSVAVYDSAQRRRPFSELRNFWQYRGLLRLLVARDITARYKRSVLGLWWTLLNPILTIGVLWMVFSNLFGRGTDEVPFIVYLTAGVLLATYFSQGVIAAGGGIVGSREILIKVHVPPEIFSLAAGLAAAINFLLALIPLVGVQLIAGSGVPWTFLLIPISVVAMLMVVTGVGLVVASAAVVFHDVFDLVGVLTLLISYLAATFYPLDIVPDRFLIFVKLNPLWHHLTLFRFFAYGGPVSWWNVLVTVGSGLLALTLGVWIFSRSWKNLVVAL